MLKNNLNSINNIRRRDPDATSEEEKLRRHCARMEEEYYTAKSDWETKDNKVKKLNAAAGVLNAAGSNCDDLNTQFANKVTKPIADAGTLGLAANCKMKIEKFIKEKTGLKTSFHYDSRYDNKKENNQVEEYTEPLEYTENQGRGL